MQAVFSTDVSSQPDYDAVMARAKSAFFAQSETDLARVLRLSTSNLANYKRRRSVPWERIFHAAHSHNVSVDYLLTGTGSMHRELREPPAATEPPAMYHPDARLRAALDAVQRWWDGASEEERGWFLVQFRREFPELFRLSPANR